MAGKGCYMTDIKVVIQSCVMWLDWVMCSPDSVNMCVFGVYFSGVMASGCWPLPATIFQPSQLQCLMSCTDSVQSETIIAHTPLSPPAFPPHFHLPLKVSTFTSHPQVRDLGNTFTSPMFSHFSHSTISVASSFLQALKHVLFFTSLLIFKLKPLFLKQF